jgi:hypothetical protein
VSLETVPVSTPLDVAQVALLPGEQRAWLESLAGFASLDHRVAMDLAL